MVPYYDPFYQGGDLPFTLLVFKILEDVGFKIDPTLGVQVLGLSP